MIDRSEVGSTMFNPAWALCNKVKAQVAVSDSTLQMRDRFQQAAVVDMAMLLRQVTANVNTLSLVRENGALP